MKPSGHCIWPTANLSQRSVAASDTDIVWFPDCSQQRKLAEPERPLYILCLKPRGCNMWISKLKRKHDTMTCVTIFTGKICEVSFTSEMKNCLYFYGQVGCSERSNAVALQMRTLPSSFCTEW